MKSDLYARRSTKDEGRSAARQERAWRTDCAAEQLELGRVFVDPDLSASRYARRGRPDYEALCAHIRAGGAEMVSVWEVTRGGRDVGPWVAFLDLLREHRVLLRVFATGTEDAVTYRPWLQRDRETLIREGVRAEAEVEQTRARTMAGTVDAAGEGRPAGPLLDGYRRVYGAPTCDSRSLGGGKRREIGQIIDEPRAQLYRWAAEGALNGVPLAFMARVLVAWGVPTASGRGAWTGHGLRRALLNPGYQGHRVHRGAVVARDAWPAVITQERADRLTALLTTPGRRSYAGAAPLRHMLSGAVLCGVCRRHLKADMWHKKGRLLLACTRPGCGRVSTGMMDVDRAVSAAVVARLRMPDAAPAFSPRPDDTSEIVAARGELKALHERMAELKAAAGRPDGPSVMLVAAVERELSTGIAVAERRLSGLLRPAALQGYDPADLAANWHSGKYEVGVKRAIVLGLAEVVLSPVGAGGRWSVARLDESRWHGDPRTWGGIRLA